MSQLAMGPIAGRHHLYGAGAGAGRGIATTMPVTTRPHVGVTATGARTGLLARIHWTRLITLVLALAIAGAGMVAVLGQANAGSTAERGDGAVVVGRDTALREHVVAPGDTIWRLAESVAPDADPRELVDRIMRLNGLTGVDVQVGTVLLIPNGA